MHLSLSLGPSFLESTLANTPVDFTNLFAESKNSVITKLEQKVLFLPGQSLSDAINKVAPKELHPKLERVMVSSRLMEKIIETRLGGSVAQIVTRGFEDWLSLRQPGDSKHFESNPSRTENLGSQELVFGINERVNSSGQITKELAMSELEFIAEKLKLSDIKKVCLQFLFSHLNPKHLKMAESFLLEKGFQVFCGLPSKESTDEVLHWRKNALNACFAGTFREMREDIVTALQDQIAADQIFFLAGDGHWIVDDQNCLTHTLFGHIESLAKASRPFFTSQEGCVLHLGREQWILLDPLQRTHFWDSPWGPIELSTPRHQKLQLQPTTEVAGNAWGEISFSTKNRGYEPGPICFGKSFHPCIVDLFFSDIAGQLGGPVSPQANARLTENLQAMLKSSRTKDRSSVDKLILELRREVFAQIAMDTIFFNQPKTVLLTGVFAPLFIKDLKSQHPQIEWKLGAPWEFFESLSLLNGALR